jgi:hypothetical protein
MLIQWKDYWDWLEVSLFGVSEFMRQMCVAIDSSCDVLMQKKAVVGDWNTLVIVLEVLWF